MTRSRFFFRACLSDTRASVRAVTTFAGLAILAARLVMGQGVTLDNLPPDQLNDRYFADIIVSQRPALSFNGISCSRRAACEFGYGVAEVLESVYGETPDPTVVPVFADLMGWAGRTINPAPEDRFSVIDNTRIFQARAAVALFSAILEGNGYVSVSAAGVPDMPLLEQAVDLLIEAARQREAYRINGHMSDDAVKWTTTVTNHARAIDLYLAYESTVHYYASQSAEWSMPTQLECAEKATLLTNLAEQIDRLDDLGNMTIIFRLNRDEVQPGNWPMKMQLAVAYASLGQQFSTASSCSELPSLPYTHWLERGLFSAGSPTTRSRSKHWNYQTDNGSRFFAEGPYYFHFALGDVVPFWHAVRLNGLLDMHPNFDLDDPFRSGWFLDPLNWLADTVTPDGSTIPFDDGNRVPMGHASIMRWTESYGDAETGRKYSWIADRPGLGMGVNANALTIELAIPRLSEGQGIAPVESLGEWTAGAAPRTEEQIALIRRETHGENGAAQTHFLAMNGEYGDAIGRGEGHEQSDQLQLIYYVDGTSVLMDSGYDSAEGLGNSTWNHYFDHNVLTVGSGEGGLQPPALDLLRARIVASHSDVDEFGLSSRGRIDVLTGRVDLDPNDVQTSEPTVDYLRRVVFVGDSSMPYLIDINTARYSSEGQSLRVSYHVAGTPPLASGQWNGEGVWSIAGSGNAPDLNIQITAFRPDGEIEARIEVDTVMEGYRLEETIGRLDLTGESMAGTFTSIVFLEAVSNGEVIARPYSVDVLDVSSGISAYAWRRNPETTDLIAYRPGNPGNLPGEKIELVAGDLRLELEMGPGANVGVLRLRKADPEGLWEADREYSYDLSLISAVSTALFDPQPETGPELSVRPNPFQGRAQIEYRSRRAGHLRLSIFDMLGREVTRIVDGYHPVGVYRATWNRESLASGVYLVSLFSEQGLNTQTLVARN